MTTPCRFRSRAVFAAAHNLHSLLQFLWNGLSFYMLLLLCQQGRYMVFVLPIPY